MSWPPVQTGQGQTGLNRSDRHTAETAPMVARHMRSTPVHLLDIDVHHIINWRWDAGCARTACVCGTVHAAIAHRAELRIRLPSFMTARSRFRNLVCHSAGWKHKSRSNQHLAHHRRRDANCMHQPSRWARTQAVYSLKYLIASNAAGCAGLVCGTFIHGACCHSALPFDAQML